jgi:hypothetical protein
VRSNLIVSFLILCLVPLIFTNRANRKDAQSAQETLLTTDNAYNPIPSPDGKYIAYVHTGWGEGFVTGMGRSDLVSDVKLVNAEGVPALRTLAKRYFLSGWTPDSTQLACYRDSRYALLTTDGKPIVAGRIPNIADEQPITEWVAYSPSLATVIWSRVVAKGHGAIETSGGLVVREERFQDRVIPSPDGRYLAAFGQLRQTELRVYDFRLESWVDLGKISIHPDKDWSYIQPNWNPWFADGSRLVFLRDSTLVISTPDAAEQIEIPINRTAGLPVPSPNGQFVAYVSFESRPMKARPDLPYWGGTTLWVVPVSAAAKPRALTVKNQDEVYDLKWLNDGSLVFDRIADELFYARARIWKVSVSQ